MANGFGFRFFASAPLLTQEGKDIGSISIMDKHGLGFEESDKTMLFNLAAFVVEEIQKKNLLNQ